MDKLPNNQPVAISNGKLTVTPAIVVVDCNYGDTVEQNGWIDRYPIVRVNGNEAPSAGYFNTFTLLNGDTLEVTLSDIPDRNAPPGEYTIKYAVSLVSDDASIYKFSYTNYNFTIVEQGTLSKSGE